MLDETKTRANMQEYAKHLNIVGIEFGNRKKGKIILGRTNEEVNRPEKIQFKGHEFELVFTSDNKDKARKEAHKCRRRGFHTRVREISTVTFSVCRRKKI